MEFLVGTGRWRGGRPRVSTEVRHLIARMARENFLWGAPRIHGELLMLGFSVSQATVSRYMPARGRRPGQSWRTFLRNQAIAFGRRENSEELSREDASDVESHWTQIRRSAAAQIATIAAVLRRGSGPPRPALNARSIRLPSARRNGELAHRAGSGSVESRRAPSKHRRAGFPIRSPPQQAWRRDHRGCGSLKTPPWSRVSRILHLRPCEGDRFELSSSETSRRSELCARGLGCEEPQLFKVLANVQGAG